MVKGQTGAIRRRELPGLHSCGLPAFQKEMTEMHEIFDMLDLFYANKYMYEKLQRRNRKYELSQQNKSKDEKSGSQNLRKLRALASV